MGTANTLFSIAFQLGQGFGVALGAVALRLADMVLVGPNRATGPGTAEFHLALVGLAVVMVLITLDAMRLAPDAGHAVTRGRPVAGPKPAG
jgi:hypothetical protein